MRRIVKQLLTIALSASLVAGGVSAAHASGRVDANPAELSQITDDTNNYRKSKGLSPVRRDADLDKVAQKWAAYLAADNRKLAHNLNLRYQVPAGWSRLGENVAVGFYSDRVTRAWWESPGHKRNILGDFNLMGLGLAYTKAGRPFAVQVFAKYPSPSISGTKKVGSTLTAKVGTWASGVTKQYQWMRGSEVIPGATGKTYKLVGADAGKKIRVRVTGTRSGHTIGVRYSSYTSAISKGTLTSAAPKITGTRAVGKTLTATTAGWSSGVKFSYQWKVNGRAVKGATSQTFTVPTSAYGKRVTVTVKGTKAGYTSKSRTSGKTSAIGKGTQKVTVAAHISEVTNIAQVSVEGVKSGSKVTYQWYVAGTAVKGATAPTFTVPATAAGKKVTVKVKVTKSGYKTLTTTLTAPVLSP